MLKRELRLVPRDIPLGFDLPRPFNPPTIFPPAGAEDEGRGRHPALRIAIRGISLLTLLLARIAAALSHSRGLPRRP